MAYVDGYLIPVPKDKIGEYRELAEFAAGMWMEHGALSYVETIADDVPHGEHTDFYRAVAAKDDETVVFAYITYESREHRDAVNAKVMADPRMKEPDLVPFDAKRMMWGGFKAFVEG